MCVDVGDRLTLPASSKRPCTTRPALARRCDIPFTILDAAEAVLDSDRLGEAVGKRMPERRVTTIVRTGEFAMEAKDDTQSGSRARPIFSERDYQAAKRLLSEHAQSLKPFLEAGRFQSLIRELSDYERRAASTPPALAQPATDSETEGERLPHRRWSDPAQWGHGHPAYM